MVWWSHIFKYVVFKHFNVLEVILIGALERYEYPSPIELKYTSGNYFVIPASIILNDNIGDKRVSIFSFFATRKGMDYTVSFSINNIVKWLGKKPDKHKEGINNKIIKTIECFEEEGYLTLDEEIDHTSCIETNFNIEKLSQECLEERFATIYVDELHKILNYQNVSKDAYCNNDTIFLVFAYLRMKIYRRRNKLFLEEINVDNKNNLQHDIEERKMRCPEAYNCFHYEIANDLGLSVRTISKAISVLNDLNLIYSEALPRIRYNDGKSEKWRTDHTVFCNFYKREKNYLLDSGEKYYLEEIENKKKKLNIK